MPTSANGLKIPVNLSVNVRSPEPLRETCVKTPHPPLIIKQERCTMLDIRLFRIRIMIYKYQI
jgi:hypothetical protein